MSDFRKFQKAVAQQFAIMQAHPLFKVEIDRDEVIAKYLDSFPSGTNELFRERTTHDCSCCKQFIRTAGNIVAITPNGLTTIWDCDIDDDDMTYQIVAETMHQYIINQPIVNTFLHYEKHIGTHHNFEGTDTGQTRWDHFHIEIPPTYVKSKDSIPSLLGKVRTNYDVLLRSLNFKQNAINTVIDLIDQNAIYRGKEFKKLVKDFKTLRNAYCKLPIDQRNFFAWRNAISTPGLCTFKNTVIGTLVEDLSNDVPLEDAVRMYESKVAPQNYKRTTALITEGMIKEAQKTVKKLGIENALYRRFAKAEDITINNVLFANRDSRKTMGADPFSELSTATKPVSTKKLDKVQEVKIDDFIKDVLPNIDSMEIMFENRHKNNLVSLVAPIEADTQPLFKWNNNFSWSYKGEVTDSIVERVKRAGGDVTGDLRFSLSWFNTDDLDLHATGPMGHVYYSTKRRGPCKLDVDMNVSSSNAVTDAVENITWANKKDIEPGNYHIYVNQYTRRNSDNQGFTVQMEFMGNKQEFHYNKGQQSGSNVTVLKFQYHPTTGIHVIESLNSEAISETQWGITTQQFHPVKLLMNSPNHWDEQAQGNKHWFFMLDQCISDTSTRGFYNEFLKSDLTKHRKVFEVLASKTKVPESKNQLSGLGFSSTKPDHVLCKLKGGFNRTIKLVF